jgi:hypothetical protein
MNLKMDLILLSGYSCGLAYVVEKRTLEWSTSSTTRSSEDAINQSEACGR